jgi:hypothetical protein
MKQRLIFRALWKRLQRGSLLLLLRLYKHFYLEGQEKKLEESAKKLERGQSKTGLVGMGAIFPQEKGSSVRSHTCQACFAGARPVRCRRWVLGSDTRWPNRRPVQHPDMRLRIGIIADSSRLRPAAAAARMDPGFCSVRFPDAEECGRRCGDL